MTDNTKEFEDRMSKLYKEQDNAALRDLVFCASGADVDLGAALARVERFRKMQAEFANKFDDKATFEAGCYYAVMSAWELARACPRLLSTKVTGVEFSGMAFQVMLRCAVWLANHDGNIGAALAIVGHCGEFLAESRLFARLDAHDGKDWKALDMQGDPIEPGKAFGVVLDRVFLDCEWNLVGTARQVSWLAAMDRDSDHDHSWSASDPARWPSLADGDDSQHYFFDEVDGTHRMMPEEPKGD